ncbi:LPD23 domain-containing protein [Ruminococcus sp.]
MWLKVNRLQLPLLSSSTYGFFNNSISQNSKNVNTKNDESSNDIKYSMGGLKAETADKSALEKAMELEKDGTDSEKIRKETGWFKGYDGKWRFEIDNSELEFKTDIEKNRAAAIELAKMKVKSAELEEKIVNNTATKAEENEYYNLDEKMIEYRKGVKLSDVINHPKLFEAYPQLKNVDVYYEISSVNRGVYSSNGNVIMLNPMHTIDEQKEAIIHEIQHAIQGIENFANGSNLEYWKNLGYSDEEAMAMYYNTAGEREARDVSARRDYNEEQRKNIRPDIDRKDVVFANSGESGYSSDENIMQDDFENKVDQIENNTYNSNDVVIMGRTPKVLQDIGFNSLPVAMTKNHIYSVAVSEARAKNEGRYKKNTNYHDLGFNTVKQIYNKISDPLMVIAHPDFTNKESRDSTHKVIALVDLSVNNKQVIAPILVDYESIYSKKRMDVNLVATYFNKNNINDLIKEAIALENNNQVGFYYLDKKRTQSIIKRTGYQLPRRLNNLSSNIIIRKIDSNVNKKINKITQSQQFVRWFGDWQNKPKTASKVVDGNGEPLVVYHQTGNDFTVFDTKHTGAGEFDSEMPTGIFMKPTNSNISLSGNKQMALYANIRNPLTVNNRAELVRFYEQNIDGYKEAREDINNIDSEYEASKKAKSLIDDYFRNSNYDGVIVNNDVGSFGRSTKTYIAFSNTQVKSATDNIGTFDGENPDIKYAIDDTKQEEVDFRKALTREEWASFYSSLNKYNQRDNLRIGDNSILIPDDNNAYNYKLVCYRTDKNNIRVKNVYLIENYDYNIHSNEINVLQILSDYEGEEYSEKQTRAILQNYTGMYGTLFKRYNSVSRKFVKLTRESVSDRRNIKETADGAGTYENSEREVSGGLSEDKIPDIRYATDDTLNDWLDDLPEGIDYEKVVEKKPVVAVAKIYNSASKTAESGLRQSQNVRLEEKDYLRIADKIMDKYGIKGKYNPNYKQELAEQLMGFIEHIGEKNSNFTDVFEEL